MPEDSAHKFVFLERQASADVEMVELAGDEHHHLSRVLRIRQGETAYVTNGRGLMLRCRVAEVEETFSRLAVLGLEEPGAAEGTVALALGCLVKDGFERAVDMCTQLGMTSCVPFAAEKAAAADRFTPTFLNRLRRISVSAMKQSFRATLPTIEPVIGFDTLLGRVREFDTVVVGDVDSAPVHRPEQQGSLLIVVGPEGGLTGAEKRRLRKARCTFASVSPNRLRSEAAAAAMMAVLLSGCR